MLRYIVRNVVTAIEASKNPIPRDLLDPLSPFLTHVPIRPDFDLVEYHGAQQMALHRLVESLEMARVNLMFRSQFHRVFFAHRLLPVIGQLSLTLHHKDALTLMAQQARLHYASSISDWDSRFCVVSQRVSLDPISTPSSSSSSCTNINPLASTGNHSSDDASSLLASARIKAIFFPVGSREAFPPVRFLQALGLKDAPSTCGTVPARLPAPSSPFENPSLYRGKVQLNQLDYNIHMNNAHFFATFEKARQLIPACREYSPKTVDVEFFRQLNFGDSYRVESQWEPASAQLDQIIVNEKTNKIATVARSTFHI